jgi:hypothetical protein
MCLGVDVSELAGMSLTEKLALADRHGWMETPDPFAMSVDEYLTRMALSTAAIIWRIELLMLDVIAIGDAKQIKAVRKLHQNAIEQAREVLQWAGLTVPDPGSRRAPRRKVAQHT